MHDDPGQIASYLIEQHGADGAVAAVQQAVATAHADKDNYRLSVWREVRRALWRKIEESEDLEASTT